MKQALPFGTIEAEEQRIASLRGLEEESRAEGNDSLAYVWERARLRAERDLARMQAKKEATK